jgi:hypothetical protein
MDISEYQFAGSKLLDGSSIKVNTCLLLKKFRNEDLPLVLLSILLQASFAIFLGHYYDQRVFMTTGYLLGSGLDPYQQYEIVGVFHHPLLQGLIPGFGYPPPWAFVLGLVFQLSYNIVPNLILYNFATKIPVIIANIGLAFLVRHIILEFSASKKKARFAFLFFLFNPFTLLTTSAWGQFDTVAVLLCVASLYFLSRGRNRWCALTLALAFSVKPIVLPLLGLPLFYSKERKWQTNLEYLAILIGAVLIFLVLPILVMRWQPLLFPDEWNAHFKTAGGLSLFAIIELFNNMQSLPQSLEVLGFLWVPALLISYYRIYRNPPNSQTDLIRKSIFLVLVFFLTRSWLSEPNLNLLLPLMLFSIGAEKATFRNFHFMWVVPLIFMFFNYSIPQLFFIPYPNIVLELASLDSQILTMRLIGKFLVIVFWQIFSWIYLLKIIHGKTSKDFNQ